MFKEDKMEFENKTQEIEVIESFDDIDELESRFEYESGIWCSYSIPF